MKILFLDIDGVLNSANFFKSRRKYKGIYKTKFVRDIEQIDAQAVKLLNKIVEQVSCKIVISSTWRILNSVQHINNVLKAKGFKGEIIDATPRLNGQIRGKEIEAWLERNQKVEKFVILDDSSDMGGLLTFLIQTNWENGLQEKHVAMVVDKFNGVI